MEDILVQLSQTDLAQAVRFSRWSYAWVSAAHILGLSILVGSIVPLDLRLLGVWPAIESDCLIRVLVPTAASGLALACGAGALLFSVRANEYADVRFFQLKLALIAIGTISAIAMHLSHGLWLERASAAQRRRAGLISIIVWPSALICGRMIAFATD